MKDPKKNSSEPSVSVIIPTYNRQHMVGRALGSVLTQTCRNIEVIVVDDGSSDDTEYEIARIDDVRIRYMRHTINRGAPAARNSGFAAARGKYVAFLDSDDEWLPDKLEKQLQLFHGTTETVGVVYAGFSYVYEKTGEIISEVIPTRRGYVYEEMLRSCIIGSPTPLIKRDCFEKTGLFDETLPGCQDWDMWIRLAQRYEFEFVPEILARHYAHGQQISVDLRAKIEGKGLVIKKYASELLRHPGIYGAHLEWLGILLSLAGDRRGARKHFIKAVRVTPSRLTGYMHLAGSLVVPGIHRKALEKRSVMKIDDINFYY